jgi:ATP-dependent 26S proteasome regulatory subunit
MNNSVIEITGVPDSVPDATAAIFRSRLDRLVRDFATEHRLDEVDINLRKGTFSPLANSENSKAVPSQANQRESKSKYVCQEPLYTRDFLVVSAEVRERLESAIQIIELQSLLFDSWGLRQIEPHPKSALNFHGLPGTGKTLAAHAVAAATSRKILCASYADIESMYHGEGPKNVVELFKTADREKAVLFIDEADSLLSKRLTNVTQGSEQAINSMRSQLLICLDNFHGIVIFATNLISNYDSAFDSRVKHIHFPAPDKEARSLLWKRHLPELLPLSGVSVDALVEHSEGMVGREIKLAVIDAAVTAARAKEDSVTQQHFLTAIEVIRQSQNQKDSEKSLLS